MLTKHEYIKPKLGMGCVRCGYGPNADVHQIEDMIPRAVQRSKRWIKEYKETKNASQTN